MGFVRAVVWAFAFVMLVVTWEVTRAEVSRVEFSEPPAEVETYDFAEFVIRVSVPDVANPFTDASVEGHFAQEGSEPVTVDGFCDSTDGSLFRIRFMPSRPGRHEYSVTYRQQDLERTQAGTFHAVASDRKGLLRLDPENRQHFIWEGTGKHYFWNGTTADYLMGWDDETIRQSIDRLASLKINRIRVPRCGQWSDYCPWGAVWLFSRAILAGRSRRNSPNHNVRGWRTSR